MNMIGPDSVTWHATKSTVACLDLLFQTVAEYRFLTKTLYVGPRLCWILPQVVVSVTNGVDNVLYLYTEYDSSIK